MKTFNRTLASKLSKGLFVLFTIFVFLSCAGTPDSGNSSAQAQAAARDALNRLDAESGGNPAESSALPGISNNVVTNSGSKPGWVDNPDSLFPRSRFIAMVGYASTREMSESNALANLAGFFKQTIRANETMTNIYQEAIKSGVVSEWTDTLAVVNTSERIVFMDEMIGAEVREIWHDTKDNVFYAVAVMEKGVSGSAYGELVQVNLDMINNLVNMTADERNSLEGYSRYLLAAAIADVNASYTGILRLLDSPVSAGIKSGDEYRLEAQNIARAIPINVTVNNDRQRRIHGAFSKAVSDLGFRSGGSNSRYVLNVNAELSEVEFADNDFKWARIFIYSELTDTFYNSVLFPYGFNLREGHTTLSEAENRAFLSSERKINNEYKDQLSEYLSLLLPVR